MEQIEDTIIYQLLIDLNIPCKEPPYTHLQNNNHSITDNKTFFIKTNTEPKGLQIELETFDITPERYTELALLIYNNQLDRISYGLNYNMTDIKLKINREIL